MTDDFYTTHKQEILTALVKEVSALPGGSKTSVAKLFAGRYPEHRSEIHEYGFELMDDFLIAAKKKGLLLDMSMHEGKVEGLPYNLMFKVYQKKPGKKCPRCGGRDTAAILYGMPAFSESFQKDLEHHRTALGGCLTGEADPKYHCFCCGKDFGTPAVLIGKRGIEKYSDIVTEIRFEVGGYFGGYETYTLKKSKGEYTFSLGFFDTEDVVRTLTSNEWQKVINKLYTGFYIHEWKKDYFNPCVTDGIQWSVKIRLTNGRRRTINGSNAYPGYWEEFRRLMEGLVYQPPMS